MTLVREVRYVPFLCRFGLHRWSCEFPEGVRDWFRLSWIPCSQLVVHVHLCRRCGRVKLEGRESMKPILLLPPRSK